MTVNDCLFTLTDLSNLVCTDPSVSLNPDYVDDPNCPEAAFSIRIWIGDVSYQFNKFYWSKTMSIEENRGFERGNAKFTICDFDPDNPCLPFVPGLEQRITISNYTEDDIYFEGKITEVKPEHIVRRDCGTEVLKYHITCSDIRTELERILIAESYENVTTGFIIRDVIRRFTPLDHTEIDPLIGTVVKDFRVNQRYPSQVIQRILDIQTAWTFWIDQETGKAYVGDILESINQTGLYIDEDNVYSIFDKGSFYLAPDTRALRNKVRFFYNRRYTGGLASATTGSVNVLGFETDWTDKMSGGKFRFANNNAEYTVSAVLSTTSLRLSSEFQEPIITTQPYELSGMRAFVEIGDHNSIMCQAELRNENALTTGDFKYYGEYQAIVSEDNNSYTVEEARDIAKSYLLDFSEPMLRGNADTNNVKLTLPGLRAGQSFRVDLPISRNIKADIIIQRIVRKDLGGVICRADIDPTDTRIDPIMSIDLDLDDRIFDERNQIKRLMADVRRVVTVDTEEVEVGTIIAERIISQTCLSLIDPLQADEETEVSCSISLTGPGLVIEDESEIGCALITTTSFPAGPFYTTPTGNPAGYAIGRTKYAAFS